MVVGVSRLLLGTIPAVTTDSQEISKISLLLSPFVMPRTESNSRTSQDTRHQRFHVHLGRESWKIILAPAHLTSKSKALWVNGWSSEQRWQTLGVRGTLVPVKPHSLRCPRSPETRKLICMPALLCATDMTGGSMESTESRNPFWCSNGNRYQIWAP